MEHQEPPTKRLRLNEVVDKKDAWDPVVPPEEDEGQYKYTKEIDVGITEFLNLESEGFDCILKYKCFSLAMLKLIVDMKISW
jgi:hypothetical protein